MQLKRKLDEGKFVILAEMEPPKGVDVTHMVGSARAAKENVDAFVVPEMSNAVMRMSSLGAAMVLQSKGMETVMQISCRDRNRLAVQADVLAGYACGITNVMAVAGEDPSYGDHHQAKAVYDISLLQLLQILGALQGGRDMAGVELAGSPRFLTGSTVNAGLQGDALEKEIDEMNRRLEAGTRFFITPPVFDLTGIEAFLDRVDRSTVCLIPTVLLLKSVGMARYIDRHLQHVLIPPELIQRIQKAPDKVRECVQIAVETIDMLKGAGFAGVQLATLGWESRLPEILAKTGR
jgi:5,10-methylenetetrahydrofolate reductase